jgi:hypothetical protein
VTSRNILAILSFLLSCCFASATSVPSNFKQHQWGALLFDAPEDWEMSEGDGIVFVIPPDGNLKLDNGQDWATHGIFVMWAQIPDSPMMACPTVEQVIAKRLPGLRPTSDCRYISIPGVPNETAGYEFTNASMRGHEDSGRIMLIRRGVGYVVFMLFSPANEARAYAPIFNRVLSSIKFQKRQSSGLFEQARTEKRTLVGNSISSEQTVAQFSSEPTHAEIIIDGHFVGTTPSELRLPSGEHEIVFWKNGYVLKRRILKAEGGSVSVHVDLEKSPT